MNGGYSGTGIVSLDPNFVNAGIGDYDLQAISPAINIGQNSAVPAWLTSDLSDSSRISLSTADAGAYESSVFQLNIIGPAALCLGRPVNFLTNRQGGTFSLTKTTVATVNATTGVLQPVALGTDTLIYSLNGNVAKKTITVNAIPNAGVATGPVQACRKDSVTYAASVTGGRWISSNPVKISINQNTGRALAADLGTTSIYYVVTNTAGCTDTAAIATTVIAQPSPAVVTASRNLACENESITFTASLPGFWYCDKSAHSGYISHIRKPGFIKGRAILFKYLCVLKGCLLILSQQARSYLARNQ